MSLRALKWLAIVLPLLFLAAVDLLRHTLSPDQFSSPALKAQVLGRWGGMLEGIV